MTNSATNQAQIYHFELVHSNISFLYELLEHVKELDLQNQSYRNTMTLGGSRLSKRSLSGDSSSINGVLETKHPDPDQRLISKNICI
ncbi:small conductance calcium-activated potassium channel protein 2 [Cricetulus griseus]|nr:small conductance calcium-activated potassium channel protein 2 [Cricetulus griseus]